MSTLAPTSLAPTQEVTPGERIQSRFQKVESLYRDIASMEQQRATLEQNMNAARRQIQDLMAEHRRESPVVRIETPYLPDDLLDDPSYETDYVFQPSADDLDRKEQYDARNAIVYERQQRVRTAESQVYYFQRLLTDGPKRIERLHNEMRSIDGGFWSRMKDIYYGERRSLNQAIAETEKAVAKAPADLEKAQAELEAAKAGLATAKPDNAYDMALHEITEATLSKRENQTAYLSVDAPGFEATLRIPTFVGEQDYSTTITFSFYTNKEEFVKLLGPNLQTNGTFDNLEQDMDYQFDFDDMIIPFPLEIVEVDGQKRYRIPDIIMKTFGPDIKK